MLKQNPTADSDRVPVSYKLPRWIVDWLRASDTPATTLIVRAVRQTYGLSPPSDTHDQVATASPEVLDDGELSRLRETVASVVERLERLEIQAGGRDDRG